jgi:hypothetical protein
MFAVCIIDGKREKKKKIVLHAIAVIQKSST